MDSKEDDLKLNTYEKIVVNRLGRTRKCKICGEEFFILDVRTYVYKNILFGRTYYYCSWSCFRKRQVKKNGVR